MTNDPVETARAYFAERDNSLLGGILADWARWEEGLPDSIPVERRRTVEKVELLDESATQVVVDVRAGQRTTIPRGTYVWDTSFDGPAVLERDGDDWRIVDFTLDGRRRSHALVVGPLAEQEQEGLTLRILGVDRAPRATSVLAEIVNDTTEEVRVEHGVLLIAGVWRRVRAQAAAIAPGATGTIALASAHTVALTQPALTIGLRARSGRRRVRFLLHAPLARPVQPLRQPPPRRLPLLQDSQPAMLTLYALLTVALAWWLGWFALIVPVFLVLLYWRQVRAVGRVPRRLHGIRHVLDALVIAACLAGTWFTPAAELTVPIAVGLVAYASLTLLRVGEGTRMLLAFSAATTWLALLGGPTDALSPCRIAGGDPGATADAFARDVFAADLAAARRLAVRSAFPYEQLLRQPLPARAAAASIAHRREATGGALCKPLAARNVTHCFLYRTPTNTTVQLWVGIGCEARRWRVELAL
jgi:hypothetical protein